jgi:hypothetical protein
MSQMRISTPTNIGSLDCFITYDSPILILEISSIARTNRRIPSGIEPSLSSTVAPRKRAKMSKNIMIFL